MWLHEELMLMTLHMLLTITCLMTLRFYIHRSGRTGRAGKKGISVAIIHAKGNAQD